MRHWPMHWIWAIALATCAVGMSAQANPLRRWTDATGKKHVYAELVRISGDQVLLKREDNDAVVTVPIIRLSPGDAQFLKHWSDASKRPALEKFCEIGDVSCDADGSIHLGLSQSGCTDNDLKLVAALPEAASIRLFECPVSDDGLAALASLPKLRALELSETDVKGAGFKHLAGITSLEEFEFSPYDFGQSIAPYLDHLSGLKNLKRLTLRFCGVGAEGLKPIGGFSNLEYLELFDCEIKSPALARIAGLTKLRELRLEGAVIDDADLVHISGMRHLHTLHLGSAQLSGAGLERIAQLKNVERLELPDTLADGDLGPLKDMQQLKWLRLSGKRITDAGLANISTLLNLEELFLPESITRAGLKHLEPLTKLKRLEITGDSVSFTEVMQLLVDVQGRTVTNAMQTVLRPDIVQDGKVTWLSLDFRPHADQSSLKYVVQLAELEHLSLGKETTDAWLADLAPLKKLKSLQIRGERFDNRPIALSAAGLKHLKACTSLESLELNDCNIGPGAFEGVVGLSTLTRLHMMDCRLAAGNAAAIGKLKSLDSLYLSDTNLGDADMVHLAGLPKLTFLSLPADVTAQGLTHLKQLKSLKRLQANWREMRYADVMKVLVEDWGRAHDDALSLFMDVQRNEDGQITSLRWAYDMPATAADLEFLKQFTHLEKLSLPKGVTDEGLANVAGLVKLRELHLESENVTDEGLAHLAGLKQLEDIYINQAPITDEGLAHLAGMTKLKDVNLHGSKVTEAGFARLQQSLPKASIRK